MIALHPSFTSLYGTDEGRWHAVQARDQRADGLLYYGVSSTRIYCRPACTARRPLRANTRFFSSCEEAETAGYRACKLCRPRQAARPHARAGIVVRPVAVLFADLQGFSQRAAAMMPDQALSFLDAFDGRLKTAVEANGGAVHKRLGDGLMALFGDRVSSPHDAGNGIRAGLDMVEALEGWNAERRRAGSERVAAGIGVHYGMVAFGSISDEPSVIGDTVNVASRLEHLTRRIGADLVVSEDTLRATPDAEQRQIKSRLRYHGMARLRGCAPRRIWVAPAA